MNIITIPNSLTLSRIILIPIFVTTLIYKRYEYSLILFIIAAVTDLLDGFLARTINQRTQLGAFLDPLADKFLLLTSFILFALYDWLPIWITITVIARDFIVVIGWFMLFIFVHQKKVEPSIIGKLANAFQAILIAYILVSINFEIDDILIKKIILMLTALFTIISGFQYVYRGYKQFYER